jgi:hypothetical protein
MVMSRAGRLTPRIRSSINIKTNVGVQTIDSGLAPIRRGSRLSSHGYRGAGVIGRDNAPGPEMDGAKINP